VEFVNRLHNYFNGFNGEYFLVKWLIQIPEFVGFSLEGNSFLIQKTNTPQV
jgi:hypothetical protein